ncbi:uncharacterized protein LOC126841392 isoform X2 [Adelges cooleyi]|uniref:uncharacterized protein LOC126841392 isoform X2 n=1 Tax=Adelges cooleyi TaxID=133065 RepID=UPI00217F80E4|nr:uncharacterized protein LOC126841392 isoform X2 [Adelges cooleyi]
MFDCFGRNISPPIRHKRVTSNLQVKQANQTDFFLTNCINQKYEHIKLAYNKKNITVENIIFSNGFEYVVSNFVDDEFDPYLGIWYYNNIIAVPEFYTFKYPYDLDEYVQFQKNMQDKITTLLEIPVPAITEQRFSDPDTWLRRLGEERRRYTAEVLKSIMNPYLDSKHLTELILEREIHPTNALNNRIARLEYKVPILRMCRLIALVLAVNIPPDFMRTLHRNDEDRLCILSNYKSPDKFAFRQMDGIWWQVEFKKLDNKILKLKEHVSLMKSMV